MIANRYELGAAIGTGGMSDVYAAQDTVLGREVAIKILRADLARDTGFRERFQKEAQNSAQLNDGAIVSVYDTGFTSKDGVDVPYIVMELVHGRTLRDVIHEDGPLSSQEAAEVMIPVAHALAVSHAAGIIHRDIKPGNIMITNTGQVKVMDFGIAHALTDTTSAMTQTSNVIGTAQYLSPEQARGLAADQRSDIYAAGCVLFEAVTGKPPFEGESPFSVAYQHVKEDPTRPSTLVPGLTSQEAINLDAVVLTAMAKDPADRYQDAHEFAADLQALANNAVPAAALQHSPTEVVAAADPAAADSAPADADYESDYESDYAEDYEEEPRKRSKFWGWLLSILLVIFLGLAGVFAYNYFELGGPGQTTTTRSITIPDLTNLSQDQALAQLQSTGLKTNVVEEASPTVPKGFVVRTSPAFNTRVPSGTTVDVIVSSGKEITEVPDVKGKNTEEALTILEEAGLKLATTVKEENSKDVAKDLIMEQSPAAGSQVSKGTEITITVSIGEETVRVPALQGTRWENAEANLKALGFTVIQQMVDSNQPEGTVVATSGEGTEQPVGSELTVQVSNGQSVTMPNLVGSNALTAGPTLASAGLPGTFTRIDVPTTNPLQVEQIARQEPQAGASVRKDTPVTLEVYTLDLLP